MGHAQQPAAVHKRCCLSHVIMQAVDHLLGLGHSSSLVLLLPVINIGYTNSTTLCNLDITCLASAIPAAWSCFIAGAGAGAFAGDGEAPPGRDHLASEERASAAALPSAARAAAASSWYACSCVRGRSTVD